MSKTIVGRPVKSGKTLRLAAILLSSTAVLSLGLTGVANADQTWTGTTSTDWFTATNWNGNAVPTSADGVVIDTIATNPAIIDANDGVSSSLTVGDVGTGALTIQNGGTLTTGMTVVGNLAGSVGTLVVDGAGSQFTSTGQVRIGKGGTGSITVQNGGTFDSNLLYVGDVAGPEADFTITGPTSSATITTGSAVGTFGSGRYSVLDGATVTQGLFNIGEEAGASAIVLVDGAGSTVTDTDHLFMGYNPGATATLTVSNGASVTSATTDIGYGVGGVATATVTDADSDLTSIGALVVGDAGTGTLNIENGGAVVADANVTVGNVTGSAGTITVDASDLNDASGFVIVGANGTGNVTVQNGGTLEANVVILGEQAGSSGNLTITGAGSSMILSNGITVGTNGTGAFSLLNGATVNVVVFDIGDVTGSGTALIDGSGTLLTSTSQLSIGNEDNTGASGTLTVSNGGGVENGRTIIGNAVGSTGTVIVTDAGSFFTSNQDLDVGSEGHGILNIENGGTVSAVEHTILGEEPGGQGVISIDGAGSSLNATQSIYIGGDGVDPTGGNGDITVTNGGAIEDYGSLFLGNAAGSTGSLTIDGTDSIANVPTGTVGVGVSGNGTLTVSGGGMLTDVTATVGADVGGTGTVLVDGANSIWATQNALELGHNGNAAATVSDGGALDADSIFMADSNSVTASLNVTGANATVSSNGIVVGYFGAGSVLVQNGGAVTDVDTIIGYQPVATANGTVTVDGASSTWNGTGAFYVGFAGTGALNVTNGGVVTSARGNIGDQANSTGTAIVDGAGSQWNTLGTLTVGGDSSVSGAGSGTLTVRNGGLVATTLLNIADYAGSTGNVTITGAGSKLTSDLAINVGGAATGTLSVLAGGVAHATTQLNVGLGAGSVGTATVDGAGSSVTATGFAIVGYGGAGTLHIQNGGAVNAASGYLGNAAGSSGTAIVDGAASQWNNTKYLEVGSDGTGKLTISNGATVSAGVETFVARYATSTGTIDIGAANGSAAAAPGTLDTPLLAFGQGDGTLNFNHTGANYTFAAAISGVGTLNQIAGSTFLTADSSFSGPTNILGGALHVNGSLKNSAVTVHNGGTLNGNGTIGNVVVQSGGTLAPGNSIGTLNVNGNYSAASGSIYQVQYDGTGADRLNVSGKATIASGAVLNLVNGGVPGPGSYTLIDAAGGLTGTFDVTGGTMASLFSSVGISYDANDVFLSVAKTKTFASVGITPNEIATGGAADTLVVTNSVSVALGNQQTVKAANAAFDQLSGEVHASIKTASLEDSRFIREAAVGRMRDIAGQSGATAEWAQAFGSWGSNDSNGNAASLDHSIGGFVAGVDMPVLADWRAGVLAGYSQTDFDVKQRNSSGGSDDYHVGIYGGTQSGALGVRLGAAYTWHDLSVARSVAFQGFGDRLSSGYDADTTQLFGDVGYRIDNGCVAFEPFADLAYVNLRTDGFRETGGAAGLASRSDNTAVTFSTLGLRGSHDVDVSDTRFTLNGTLGWRHAFGDVTPSSTVAFAGSTNFDVLGVPVARDSLAVDAGLDLTVALGVKLGLSYTGQIASHARDNGLRGNLSWQL